MSIEVIPASGQPPFQPLQVWFRPFDLGVHGPAPAGLQRSLASSCGAHWNTSADFMSRSQRAPDLHPDAGLDSAISIGEHAGEHE